MTLLRIEVVSIPVKDQTAAKAFYSDVLGFVVLRDLAVGENQRWVQLMIPETETTISLVTWFDAMAPGALQGLVLKTADIEATSKELQAKGLEISPIQDMPWGRFATFKDPDGNGYVLRQAPAGEMG